MKETAYGAAMFVLASMAMAGNALAEQGCGVTLQQQQGAQVLGDFLGGLAGHAMSRAGIHPGYAFNLHLRNFLSSVIACSLTAKEQNRAADTQTASLNSGETGSRSRRQWSSDERSGVGGNSEVVSRNNTSGRNCAVTKTMITDENGEEKSVEKQLCETPDGQWA
jgi:hypothetical protein